jgi:hypothetical protein
LQAIYILYLYFSTISILPFFLSIFWLIFIEDSPEEVRQMAMNNDPAIAKAEELLGVLGQSG